ncbi:hypothetical protein D3C76_1178150 [compost metagenome]
MKAHPFAQFEGVGQAIVGNLDLPGQQRADGRVLTMGHQAFDDVQHDGIGVLVAVDAGLGTADIGIEAHAQRGVGLGNGGPERDHAKRLQGDAKRSVQ